MRSVCPGPASVACRPVAGFHLARPGSENILCGIDCGARIGVCQGRARLCLCTSWALGNACPAVASQSRAPGPCTGSDPVRMRCSPVPGCPRWASVPSFPAGSPWGCAPPGWPAVGRLLCLVSCGPPCSSLITVHTVSLSLSFSFKLVRPILGEVTSLRQHSKHLVYDNSVQNNCHCVRIKFLVVCFVSV